MKIILLKFNPEFKKDLTDPDARENRLWSEAAAKSIVAACRNKKGTVTEESKPATQLAPQLFDLTSLQREANARFGFSAKNTLGLAQALYEKHKALTYPRTDSRALPEDYIETVKQTLAKLAQHSEQFSTHADKILQQNWVKPNKRIFDNQKISDHFAIIPTLQAPKNLSEPEQKLYQLVVQRFLAIFFPAAEYLITTRTTIVNSHYFKTEGKILMQPGWLAVYGKEAHVGDSAADKHLVAVAQGEKVSTEELHVLDLHTKPPPRYSEATLLSAMEGAGKLVDDDDLRGAMAGKGLGTPATRAAIIEGLLGEKYIVREGRELIPTAKAFQLMILLRGLGVEELTLPQLTGAWEYKLAQMERGHIQRTTFMQEIAQMTQRIVKRAKEYDSDTIPGDYATLMTPCPHCSGVVHENYRRYACTNCAFNISKIPGGRQFETPEVEALLKEHTLGPLQGFRSKMGRPFAAILKLVKDTEINNYKLEFDFGNSSQEDSEPIDLSQSESVGLCPKCQAGVYEHGMRYVCQNAVAAVKTCDFSTGKIVLQQEISREQVTKLLEQGKTDLLTGFRSSRTGRNFKAYLVKQADGKIGFEFEARQPSKNKTPKSSKARADSGVDKKEIAARSVTKKGSTKKNSAKSKVNESFE